MIPVFKPSYNEGELETLKEPFLSGSIGLGYKTKEFEDSFADYLRIEFA